MSILLISNMYPSVNFPFFGTFVKNCEKVITDNNITIDKVVIDKKGKNFLNKLYIYINFYLSILYKLIFGSYEYVYAHYVSHISVPLLIYSFFDSKIKIVVHVHGGDIKKLDGTSTFFFKIKYILSYLILKKSDKIIVPSQSYKIFLETNFKFALDKDVVVYPSGGIDCNIFYANKNKRLNCYRLGFAGRLVRSKNIHLILETLPYINDYTLDIIGEGPELQSLQLLVNKLNIQDRVLFIGAKSQRDLADWYRNIDCLIYPSESESLGLVPIEAMACGVSVILSDIPAFRELKSTGFIVNIIDDMTARAIYEKIKHVEIYDSNPFFNSNLVEKLYSSDNVKKDLINVFK